MSTNSVAIARLPPAWRSRISALLGEFRLDGTILASFVVSRVLVLAAALAAEYLIVRNPLLIPGDGSPILTSLTSWDAWYYLGIVRDGYHADPVAGLYRDTAFLPRLLNRNGRSRGRSRARRRPMPPGLEPPGTAWWRGVT